MNIAETYLEHNEQVMLLDRHRPPSIATRYFDELPGKWSFTELDVTDAQAVERCLRALQPQRVFYAAAVTSGANREREQPNQVIAVNISGLTHTIKAAHAAGVERMINVSSGSAYGEGGFAESGAVAPLREYTSRSLPNSLYSVSKFASEGVSRRLAELLQFDVFSVRLSAVFGPWELDSGARDTLSAPMQAAELALKGREAVVSRHDQRDWTYSRDVAKALRALMAVDQHHFDLYNISSGKACSLCELTQLLATHFPGYQCRVVSAGEDANIDLHGERDRLVMSNRLLEKDIGHLVASDPNAMMADFIAWMKQFPGFWSHAC